LLVRTLYAVAERLLSACWRITLSLTHASFASCSYSGVYEGALAKPMVPVVMKDCSAAISATTAVMVIVNCGQATTIAVSTSSSAGISSVNMQHSSSTYSVQHMIDMAHAAGAAVVTVILVSSMAQLISQQFVTDHTCILNLTLFDIYKWHVACIQLSYIHYTGQNARALL
jgi:hypothetical protein